MISQLQLIELFRTLFLFDISIVLLMMIVVFIDIFYVHSVSQMDCKSKNSILLLILVAMLCAMTLLAHHHSDGRTRQPNKFAVLLFYQVLISWSHHIMACNILWIKQYYRKLAFRAELLVANINPPGGCGRILVSACWIASFCRAATRISIVSFTAICKREIAGCNEVSVLMKKV